jgi:hypothetical protein
MIGAMEDSIFRSSMGDEPQPAAPEGEAPESLLGEVEDAQYEEAAPPVLAPAVAPGAPARTRAGGRGKGPKSPKGTGSASDGSERRKRLIAGAVVILVVLALVAAVAGGGGGGGASTQTQPASTSTVPAKPPASPRKASGKHTGKGKGASSSGSIAAVPVPSATASPSSTSTGTSGVAKSPTFVKIPIPSAAPSSSSSSSSSQPTVAKFEEGLYTTQEKSNALYALAKAKALVLYHSCEGSCDLSLHEQHSGLGAKSFQCNLWDHEGYSIEVVTSGAPKPFLGDHKGQLSLTRGDQAGIVVLYVSIGTKGIPLVDDVHVQSLGLEAPQGSSAPSCTLPAAAIRALSEPR